MEWAYECRMANGVDEGTYSTGVLALLITIGLLQDDTRRKRLVGGFSIHRLLAGLATIEKQLCSDKVPRSRQGYQCSGGM